MKHKNWHVICTIADMDLMWSIALLNLATQEGRRVMEVMPRYFTDQEVQPIPLSSLKLEASKNAGGRTGRDYQDLLKTNGALPKWMPAKGFDKFGKNRANLNLPVLPPGINVHSSVGMIVHWEGKPMVVVENNQFTDGFWLVPAELIAIDK